MPNSFKDTDLLSGINTKLADFTSVQVLTTRQITSGAGASGTATIVGVGLWSVNNVWIDVSANAANLAATGCEIRMFGRAASGTPWARFITNSGLQSATYLIPVKGSGTDMSGQSYYGDLKVEVYNMSSSATCTINAYVLSRKLY